MGAKQVILTLLTTLLTQREEILDRCMVREQADRYNRQSAVRTDEETK